MNEAFIKLYEDVKNTELLKEVDGFKPKNLTPLIKTVLLFPTIYTKEKKLKRKDFDIVLLYELYNFYKEVMRKNLSRKILIGKDKEKAYKIMTENYEIYDKGIFKTKIYENEIHFTISKEYDSDFIFGDEYLDVFMLDLSEYQNNVIKTNLRGNIDGFIFEDLTISKIVGLSGIPMILFFVLFEDYGFINHELSYLAIINRLFLINRGEDALLYANTNFFKSYYELFDNRQTDYPGRDLMMADRRIKTLLTKYNIELLKDLSVQDAIRFFLNI